MTSLQNKIIDRVREDGAKEGEDYFSFHQRRFEHLFELLDKQEESKRNLLEVGFGFLHSLIAAYYLGYQNLFGIDIDINENILNKVSKKFNFTLKQCDLVKDKIPFETSFLILFY